MASPYQPSLLSIIPLIGSGITPFVAVHEDPREGIQGGSAGQHYHLTAAQLADLVALASAGPVSVSIYEPAMSSTGELLTASSGDCMMLRGPDYVTQ